MAWTHYRELIVWQKAMDLADEVYALTRRLPKEEQFALSDQLRRAAVSVPSNIAEGHGRQTEKEFKQFLSIAKGSVYELETQITICLRQGYLTEEQAHSALSLCEEVGKMLTRLMSPPLKTKN
ncbi:MAG: four helix bundle protein [Oscillospiraceae bacterium]|nr:four helix bundle protein [Oscillospiraceae bacterium]